MHSSLTHYAESRFWHYYRRLPESVRALADKNFALLKQNPRHPSLRLKRVGRFWSVRIGLDFRAMGRDREGGIVWFWIGAHDEYNQRL